MERLLAAECEAWLSFTLSPHCGPSEPNKRLRPRPREKGSNVARSSCSYRRIDKYSLLRLTGNDTAKADLSTFRLFRKGEFARRLLLDELRKANGKPITTAAIVASILDGKRLPNDPALFASLNEGPSSICASNASAGPSLRDWHQSGCSMGA